MNDHKVQRSTDEEERAAYRERFHEESQRLAVNVIQRFECRECFNSGLRYIDDPQGRLAPTGIPYRGVVRCDRCNTNHFRSQNYYE